eukprot:Skav223043  [mRNA]  locus=scaffold1069:163813:168437:+ [translate_table: standard]
MMLRSGDGITVDNAANTPMGSGLSGAKSDQIPDGDAKSFSGEGKVWNSNAEEETNEMQRSPSSEFQPTFRSLREGGVILMNCAKYVERCKSWPMIPTNLSFKDKAISGRIGAVPGDEPPVSWVALTDWGLDDMADESVDDKKGQPPSAVWEQLQRFTIWDEQVTSISFEQFFRSKNVDYQGEEIKIAQRIVWEAVENSLPDGVGQLPLQSFCRLGTLHYVENFDQYLVPPSSQRQVKPPTVMVSMEEWPLVCKGLVAKGVCEVWPLDQVHHINGSPLLNGMFSVGKGEYVGLLETQRLIMNLVPTNAICLPIKGDVGTLPMITGFQGVLLEEGEMILTSSEDVRCFFYLFAVPQGWKKYLGFNRRVPEELVPPEFQGRSCVLVSRVLPMGFANSVSIAQHVHRNVISWVGDQPTFQPEGELRRDKPPSSSKTLHRVYLDNFDLLELVDRRTAELIKDSPSDQILSLRHTYEQWGVPRHPRKAVERKIRAEVQGALVLGDIGIVVPKPQKVAQYLCLGMQLVARGKCSLKELQIVCGGLVYLAMFRRPLLAALNQVWTFMQSFKDVPPVVKLDIPKHVMAELYRFLCLIPLAQMNFRAPVHSQVTCSDASSKGGGFCVSRCLSQYGVAAANAQVRGDVPEAQDLCQVLSVGLFDGLGALRLACDMVGLPMAGHISVETDASARRVVEAFFADTVFHDDITTVTEHEVRAWACQFQNVGLVIVGAGPPCQGVSGLNSQRRGALRDHRSVLFLEVPRVVSLFQKFFPWAQVHHLGESVASMDETDRGHMNEAFQEEPWRCDSYGLSLCHRPRLYWVTWELLETPGVTLQLSEADGLKGTISFSGRIPVEAFVEKGWQVPEGGLPTFTTPRPRAAPGRRPAGLHACQPHEKARWEKDQYRYPPYQYQDCRGLRNSRGDWRMASVSEKEALMGFPVGFTKPCMAKHFRTGDHYEDTRHKLLGNSWQLGPIAFLLSQLGHRVGLASALSAQEIIDRMTPGRGSQLASLLLRPPLNSPTVVEGEDCRTLSRKILGLVSVKGEDILLQASSEQLVKYEQARLRFYAFLKDSHVALPRQRDALDGLLCDFLEYLWATGEGKGVASDTIAGLQDHDPRLRGHFPASWRLLKAWSMAEIPNRAPPLPERVLLAMVGWAIFKEEHLFGLSLLLAFYGLLRTGELYDVTTSALTMDSVHSVAVLPLGLTKGGKRTGAAESVTVQVVDLLRRLWQWKNSTPRVNRLVPSIYKWRQLFNQCLESLEIADFGFRPYSLRRGGATFWFQKHGSFDKLLVQGRWQAAKAARVYLNEGLALLAELTLPQKSIQTFHRIYTVSTHQSLPVLEHSFKKGRAGASGKKTKKARKASKRRGRGTPLFRFSLKGIGELDNTRLGE